MRLFSEPADGPNAARDRERVGQADLPRHQTAYEIPNAMVGYQPGFGMVADCWPQGANSNYIADAGDCHGGGEK